MPIVHFTVGNSSYNVNLLLLGVGFVVKEIGRLSGKGDWEGSKSSLGMEDSEATCGGD